MLLSSPGERVVLPLFKAYVVHLSFFLTCRKLNGLFGFQCSYKPEVDSTIPFLSV